LEKGEGKRKEGGYYSEGKEEEGDRVVVIYITGKKGKKGNPEGKRGEEER